jgi:hypothetical protein
MRSGGTFLDAGARGLSRARAFKRNKLGPYAFFIGCNQHAATIMAVGKPDLAFRE